MIFYAHDLEIYRDQLRGFYFDYDSFVPGPVARNMNDLFNVIAKWNEYFNSEYDEKLAAFREEFTTFETGEAAKQIAELMIKLQYQN